MQNKEQLLNHENHENHKTTDEPGATGPQPKEKTAKDAKSAKNLFFLRLSSFSWLKKGCFRVLEIVAACADSAR
jgi:hypothetical protein